LTFRKNRRGLLTLPNQALRLLFLLFFFRPKTLPGPSPPSMALSLLDSSSLLVFCFETPHTLPQHFLGLVTLCGPSFFIGCFRCFLLLSPDDQPVRLVDLHAFDFSCVTKALPLQGFPHPFRHRPCVGKKTPVSVRGYTFPPPFPNSLS